MNVRIKYILIFIVFGTLGVVCKFIPLTPGALVFYRSILAAIFLVCFIIFTKKKIDFKKVKEYRFLIFSSTIALVLNWVFQFEAFKITSVSVSTVCYNTMPIFTIMLAPILLKEKITKKSIVCILIAFLGIICVSGVLTVGIRHNELLGLIYALLGAIFYALDVLINKKMADLSGLTKITIQLIISSIIILPYIMFLENGQIFFVEKLDTIYFIRSIILLLFVSVLMTGYCYYQYYDNLPNIKAQTLAVFTYIDPMVALLLSCVVLKERLDVVQWVGVVLILMATVMNEVKKR